MNRRPMRFLAVVASLVIASSCNEAPGGASPQVAGCPVSQPPALAAGETRTVTIATDLGEMVIRIEADLPGTPPDVADRQGEAELTPAGLAQAPLVHPLLEDMQLGLAHSPSNSRSLSSVRS